RQRDLARLGQLQPAPSRGQSVRHAEGARELLHEERQTVRAVVDRTRESRRGWIAEKLGEQLAGLVLVERLERELLQVAAAAEVVPELAQCVVAREPIGP